ncbi:helix-turn-helix domain-containing protein [Agrilutibacter solisilvae]|uniref:Helix-turn-helix domain-containing protein n=1 Tax=Agrilutibacter solisilvae TaxID=2763317 RepID=A0A974Y2D9_9GAMM|nr:helix-turn-helix domain-containing protein [Lysobacter solisilvae]QSX79155.1 helix-turn-helix domain-containing protein [Lysobacter solisilvae]
MSDTALALLQLLAQEDGQSLPRVAKRLGVSASELQRLLTALGADTRYDGLDLVETRTDGARTLLWLTAKGRQLCANP